MLKMQVACELRVAGYGRIVERSGMRVTITYCGR